MEVKTKYDLRAKDGRTTFPSLHEWVQTLTEEEQQKFHRAAKRQQAHTDTAVKRGDLAVELAPHGWHLPGQTSPKFIWKDEETAHRGKGHDQIWLKFWNRYISENNLSFKIVSEE
jgi:hypothetical protein